MRPRLREVCLASTFAVLSIGLLGASCDKKSAASPTDAKDQPNVPFEAPGSSGAASAAPAAKPAASAAASGPAAVAAAAAKPKDPKERFAVVAEKIGSPCGKPQSLAKSLAADASCKRNPFAQKYVQKLIDLDLSDEEIQLLYEGRYTRDKPKSFNLNDSPHEGNASARVVIVEFFDYACPHCKKAAPVLEQVVQSYPGDVVLYFKHFPLHPESPAAARAAVAAQKQGKFLEMHKILFANQGSQSREDLVKYAKQIGLDMTKFQADLDSPATAAKVAADKAEGEAAQIHGTPAVYLGGRTYSGNYNLEEMADWITEEKEVNR